MVDLAHDAYTRPTHSPDLSDSLGPIPELTAGVIQAARLAVASVAKDARDCLAVLEGAGNRAMSAGNCVTTDPARMRKVARIFEGKSHRARATAALLCKRCPLAECHYRRPR